MTPVFLGEGMRISEVNRKKIKRLKTTMAAKRKKQPKKPPSITKLMQECDRLFSLRVRRLGSMKDIEGEFNYCFTCGKGFNLKKLQCGHFLSRYYKAARWDDDNARPQCMMCNMWKRGDAVVFRQNLVKEIGLKRVEAVEAKRTISFKLTREYLLDLIAKFT